MKYRIDIEDAVHLANWYEKNKRQLPWRDTGNPYDVWLSEVMLQQTRIEAVKEKFKLFQKELPTITDLANCEEDRLMRLWEGLGYYSRARNLKKCARMLVEEYGGELPADYPTLLKLPGIGPYTAGAIASLAFGIPVPAVDGNVMRVLSRYFADEQDIRQATVRKMYEEMIRNLFLEKMDNSFVRNWNQGVMELGETICIPTGSPNCMNCPFFASCCARKEGKIDTIPYRSRLKDRKIVERTLLVIKDGEHFLIHKRPTKGLLAGLYEFYGVDCYMTKEMAIQEVEKLGVYPLHIKVLPEAKHIFSHIEWNMHAYEVQTEQIEEVEREDFYLVSKEKIQEIAFPSAFKTYIEYYALREKENKR